MTRRDRLTQLMDALDATHPTRAEDLADRFAVSTRTIYRDMHDLKRAGVAIEGTRGSGYRAAFALTLPPVNMSETELEALYLGLAVVEQGADAHLAKAAAALSERLDTVLPQERARPVALTIAAAISHLGVRHIAPFRAALRARQKLKISLGEHAHVLRPASLRHWGRLWLWEGWSETAGAALQGSLDQIDALTPLPELFEDVSTETRSPRP